MPDTEVAIHTIPVPFSWSIEQAWEAISRGDTLSHLDGPLTWANIETLDGRFVRVLPVDHDA